MKLKTVKCMVCGKEIHLKGLLFLAPPPWAMQVECGYACKKHPGVVRASYTGKGKEVYTGIESS